MLFGKLINKCMALGGYEIRRIEMRKNPYIDLPKWEYQKKLVLPVIEKDAIVRDIGCGHNPIPPSH